MVEQPMNAGRCCRATRAIVDCLHEPAEEEYKAMLDKYRPQLEHALQAISALPGPQMQRAGTVLSRRLADLVLVWVHWQRGLTWRGISQKPG